MIDRICGCPITQDDLRHDLAAINRELARIACCGDCPYLLTCHDTAACAERRRELRRRVEARERV